MKITIAIFVGNLYTITKIKIRGIDNLLINNIIENKIILYGIISICILILFIQLITIEYKFIFKFGGEIFKNIFSIFILSKITVNSMQIINKASKEPSIIKILSLFYENYLWIVLILAVLYTIDKFTQKKISDNYLNYIIYSLNLIIYTSFCLKRSIWVIALSCLFLIIIKLYNYKKIIKNKYERLIKITGKVKYTFYFTVGFIVTYISMISTINEPSDISNLIACILFYLIIFNKYRFDKKEEKTEEEINELSDEAVYSKDKLFETRKKELEYIVNYFNIDISKIDEPFAISISGKWGEGKSSLTNVLKKELDDKYIIFDIQPMVTDTRDGLIKYFFSNLEKQFIYYGLLVGNGSSIESYFSSILKLIDNKGLISIKQEVKDIKSSKFYLRDKKKDLQEDIKALIKESKKEILIIIDDFDRIDDNVKYSVLTFIKEIINFNGIKSLILLDYSTLKGGTENKITYEFLEKFINKRFELSRLSIDEILEYYENILIEHSDEAKDSLDTELDKLIKSIRPEIDNIISSIENKIGKYEKDLENSNKENESEDRYKKINIEKLDNLNNKIKDGIGNTRKVKRIIREVLEKVEYIKYLYSKFNNLDKKELVKNINLTNTIITMILIKVLYEEEFDKILRSKDLFKYIKSSKNSEVYELIYCTIFEDHDKIYHNYGKKELDIKLVEFINNAFICINTPQNIFDFRNEQEQLLDIISNDTIHFENDKSVFENIKNLYEKVYSKKLESYMKNISEYISEELKKGNIELDKSVQLISNGSSFDGIANLNKRYISTLRKCLERKDIIYKNITQKQVDENFINICIKEIISSNKNRIAFILSYKMLKYNTTGYNTIREELESYNTIEDLNKYMNKLLNNVNVNESLSKEEIFLQFLHLERMYDDNINHEKINEEMREMIQALIDLEFIKKLVKNSELNVYKPKVSYDTASYLEIMNELEHIENYVKNESIDDKQRYDLIVEFRRIIYRLSKENMKLEEIKLLDKIYLTMYNDLKFKEIETDIVWENLELGILIIKKNSNNLKIIK